MAIRTLRTDEGRVMNRKQISKWIEESREILEVLDKLMNYERGGNFSKAADIVGGAADIASIVVMTTGLKGFLVSTAVNEIIEELTRDPNFVIYFSRDVRQGKEALAKLHTRMVTNKWLSVSVNIGVYYLPEFGREFPAGEPHVLAYYIYDMERADHAGVWGEYMPVPEPAARFNRLNNYVVGNRMAVDIGEAQEVLLTVSKADVRRWVAYSDTIIRELDEGISYMKPGFVGKSVAKLIDQGRKKLTKKTVGVVGGKFIRSDFTRGLEERAAEEFTKAALQNIYDWATNRPAIEQLRRKTNEGRQKLHNLHRYMYNNNFEFVTVSAEIIEVAAGMDNFLQRGLHSRRNFVSVDVIAGFNTNPQEVFKRTAGSY